MKAYIARLDVDQHRPREIVGIFVADSLSQLHDLVDECCDVDRVEIMELGPGGLHWDKSVNFVVPYPKDQAEDAPGLPGDASMSDLWLGAFFDENDGAWQPLLAVAE